MEEKQTTEVREDRVNDGIQTVNRQTVSQRTEIPANVMAKRVVYYIGGVLVTLIAIRFVLQLLGAAQGTGFVDFIYGLSGVFVMPFYGIFGQPTYGSSQLESSALVAIVVYGLLTVGIGKLLTLNARDV